MKKIVSVLFLLCLSISLFGQNQSFVGSYRAHFISITDEPETSVEFEVQPNGTVIGKITVGETVTAIRGQVDSAGNLEAKSEGGNANYVLKSDLSRGGKITLANRSETKTAGNRNVSKYMVQGYYSKIETPAAQNLPPSVNPKSELLIEQPNPLYEKNFSAATVKVVVEKKPLLTLYHLEMTGGEEMDERGFYFSIARPQDSAQKIWKAENIRALNYVEKIGFDQKTAKYANINRFRADYEMWLKNRNVYSGEIELVSEDSRQMVFKVTNLKIKNEVNNEMVTINGIVRAEISR